LVRRGTRERGKNQAIHRGLYRCMSPLVVSLSGPRQIELLEQP
jgi:hypothetical protein